ncbi:hypothetical protein BLNAU_2802 [Blattamonas nauphoetae]|uniref:Uncharacterized protein n=1 Tax=Blattamonas nauphoetae TaxID=2049346 RepID=A0ABQ9YEE9_9EUKA|nr:hypothetical protein BLNAU_2802 [Blattamonas nauphoetae]
MLAQTNSILNKTTRSAKAPQTPGTPSARLSILNEKVLSIHGDQEKLAAKKKQEEEGTMKKLRDDICSLEQNISTELQDRQESGHVFKVQLDDRAAAMQANFDQIIQDRTDLVIPQLESTAHRFSVVERNILEKDRDIERLVDISALLKTQLQKLENDLVTEAERRNSALNLISERLSTLVSSTSTEMAQQEKEFRSLLTTTQNSLKQVEVSHEQQMNTLTTTFEQVSELVKTRFNEEKELRTQSESQMVETIDQVFSQFQEGLTTFKA